MCKYWKQTTVFVSSTYVDLRYITMIFLKIITWNATRTLPTTSWVAQKHTHPIKVEISDHRFLKFGDFTHPFFPTESNQPPTFGLRVLDIHRYGGISIATHPELGFAHTFQHLMGSVVLRGAGWRCPFPEIARKLGEKKKTNGG